jgi:ribonuclease P protein component
MAIPPASESCGPPTTPAGPESPRDGRLRLPTRLRLRRQVEFTRLLRAGGAVTDGVLTVWGGTNGLGYPRLGLIVGRKHGGAVQRNRLKRLLREAFRLEQRHLPAGLDLVCTPRVGVKLTLSTCRASLLRLAARLQRLLGERRP